MTGRHKGPKAVVLLYDVELTGASGHIGRHELHGSFEEAEARLKERRARGDRIGNVRMYRRRVPGGRV